MKVIGYYKESKPAEMDQGNEKHFYIVVFENNTTDNKRKWLECYNIMEGHEEIKDKEYLSLCKKISKEEYMKATEGWYTPQEYL